MKRAITISIVMASAASAASVKAGGTIFSYYANILSNPDTSKIGYAEFGVTRAYLDLKADFVEKDKDNIPPFLARARATYDAEPLTGFVRITPDPADSTPPSVSISDVYMGFLKFAYGEIGAFRGMPGELWLRIGQIPTPWTGNEEGLWGLRYVAKVMTDEYKVLNTADRGLGLEYKLPSGYGSVHATYMNGEGFKSGEVNEFKDMGARVSVFPLAGMNNPALSGLGIHGYYHLGKPTDDQVRGRTIIGASYAYKENIGVMGSYLMAKSGSSDEPTNSSGYSAWAWFDLGKFVTKTQSFGFFGRYDNFDPNTEEEDDATSFLIAGAYYNFAKGWQLALDYQTKTPEDPEKDPTSIIYLHLLSQF
ncbi:MAG: hypothetical protein ABIN66_04970 [candidate division WOR-3 bacterium]